MKIKDKRESIENFTKLKKFSKKKIETLKFTAIKGCKFQNQDYLILSVKKINFLLIVVILLSANYVLAAKDFRITNISNTLFFVNGNVGIGTAGPANVLDIVGLGEIKNKLEKYINTKLVFVNIKKIP